MTRKAFIEFSGENWRAVLEELEAPDKDYVDEE